MITLTGVTTSGIPHLGNYVGAIRPAIQSQNTSYFFLADLHALIKCDDPNRLNDSIYEVAAAWLASGIDLTKSVFYRQSHIPSISELNWILGCSIGKGHMDRMHAFKSATDVVSIGLYTYPILMSADILAFNATHIPVGKDQVQHIELTKDIAGAFNSKYGETFVKPEAVVSDDDVLLGLDGRKMSKSYDNTIPLFKGGTDAVAKSIGKIKTDSTYGEIRTGAFDHIISIAKPFCTPEELDSIRNDIHNGVKWKGIKDNLIQLIDRELSPMRVEYNRYIADRGLIDSILTAGAKLANGVAVETLDKVKHRIGLYGRVETAVEEKAKQDRPKIFKENNKFYYRKDDVLFGPFDTYKEIVV